MTKKELSQLFWLKKEIARDEIRLKELEDQATAITANNDGMPRAPGFNGGKIENIVPEIIDLKAIIAAKRQQCIYERNRLERFIAEVPDSLTRQIMTLRYIDRMSWVQVAVELGGGNTEAGVRMICNRYLKSLERPAV